MKENDDTYPAEALLLADLFSNVMMRVLSQNLIAELSNRQISFAQIQALRYVWRHEHVLMGDLAEGLSITYPSATNMVKRLERRKLVRRKVNPVDRREVEVVLTEAGRAMVEQMERERGERLAATLAAMPASDRAALLQGLRAFLQSVMRELGDVSEYICLRCGEQASPNCPVCAARGSHVAQPPASSSRD